LGVDLALLGVGVDRKIGQKEHERDDLQPFEQHDCKGVERLLAVPVAKPFHRLAARATTRQRLRSGPWSSRTGTTKRCREYNIAPSPGSNQRARQASCTSPLPCRRS